MTGVTGRCARRSTRISFFVEGRGNPRDAKRVCKACPVKAECLEDALEMEARPEVTGRYGVYGGIGPRGRTRIAVARQRAAERGQENAA